MYIFKMYFKIDTQIYFKNIFVKEKACVNTVAMKILNFIYNTTFVQKFTEILFSYSNWAIYSGK